MDLLSIDNAVSQKISATLLKEDGVDILFVEAESCRCGAEGRVCVRQSFGNEDGSYSVMGTHFCLNADCQIIDSDMRTGKGPIPADPLCPVCGRRD